MAQKVEVILTCDLDADDVRAVETVTFEYDGVAYEFELCETHLTDFRKVMDGYAAAARRTGRPRAVKRAAAPDIAAIRHWARTNGHTVSDRGRISADVRAAFEAAQR